MLGPESTSEVEIARVVYSLALSHSSISGQACQVFSKLTSADDLLVVTTTCSTEAHRHIV